MRILIYGAGVLGCNLANDLFRSGRDVTLLARGTWGEELRKNGLRIRRSFLPGETVSRIPVISELKAADRYDVIFVAVRYTQLDSVLETLRQNVSPNVVFVGNNVRASHYAAQLPEKAVLFAFASAAGRRENGRVVSLDLRRITIGPAQGCPDGRALADNIFAGTKYRVTYEPCMEDHLLCHAAFILPGVFACYHAQGDLRRIRKDEPYLRSLLAANREGYRAIRQAGHLIRPAADESFESDVYGKNMMRFFHLLCSTGLGRLCVSDHAMNATEEMSALNRDLKVFFDQAGAEYPIWRALELSAGSLLLP